MHYDACFNSGRTPWRYAEHPTSLSWFFRSKGLRSTSLFKPSRCMGNPTLFLNSPLSFHIFRIRSAFPLTVHASPIVLSSLLSATSSSSSSSAPLRQPRTVLLCVRVCASVLRVGGVCAVIDTQNDQKKSGRFIFAKAATQLIYSSTAAVAVQRQPRSKLSHLCQ